MRKIWIAILMLSCINSYATNYYFATGGNDITGAGTLGSPWASILKFNSVFGSKAPGDFFLFNKGDVFFGTMVVSRSGSSGLPITIGAYGSGAAPIVTGFVTATGWTSIGTNLWESAVIPTGPVYENIVVINGVNTPMGRTPNTGYYNFQSFATTSGTVPNQITASILSGFPNWANAELVVNLATYRLARNKILSQSGSQLNYTPDPEGSGFQTNSSGIAAPTFIIQNDARTLDIQNEWYYKASTKQLDVYSVSMPAAVRLPVLDSLVKIGVGVSGGTSYSWITFDGLSFQGANTEIIQINHSPHITFQNCDFQYSGRDGIYGAKIGSAINLSVTNCTFNYFNNTAIDVPTIDFDFAYIGHNIIKNCGVNYGMIDRNDGVNNANTAQAISAAGASSVIEYNKIDSMGFMGIRFYGNSSITQNNIVRDYCLVLNDGGGIYTWNGSRKEVKSGIIVRNNIVYNKSTLAGNGADYCIYFDDLSNGIEAYGNSCFDASWGMEIHNAFNINIHDNTFYNNSRASLTVITDSVGAVGGTPYIAGHPNNDLLTFQNNIFFAKAAAHKTTWYYRSKMPLASMIPTNFSCDNNFYCRPIDANGLMIYTNFQPDPRWGTQASTNRNLPMWVTYSTGKDAASLTTPVTISNVNQLDFEYNDTTVTVIKTLPAGVWVDVSNTSYSGTVSMAPFTSLVLMNTGASNVAPTANAGIDQTIQLPTAGVTLAGSGTDPDGTIASYTWTKVSGTGGTITSPSSATTTITGLTQGVYQYKLQVADNLGATGSDIVIITVNAANVSPTANAGSDQAIQLPASSTTLSGTDTDPDGTITARLWTRVSGPNTPAFGSATSATTTVTGLIAGTYVFNYRVTDNQTATGNDQVTVIVSASANVAPTANAGIDQTIQLPVSSVSLAGSGTDPDGTIVSYNWQQTAGPAATITSASSASTTVTGMNSASTYQFKLTVTDNGGLQGSDNMIVTVTAANIPPLANAGSDQSITLPTTFVTLSGSASDPDGSITSHNWTKISGPAGGTITSSGSYTTTVTGLTQGTYVFRLTATDNQSATGFDELTVLVNAAININPTANAGSDQVLIFPTTSVNLSGSGTDPDGTIAAYNWTKISGPGSGVIANPNAAATTVTGLTLGVYQFQLQVTDNSGGTGTDIVQVTLNPGAASLAYTVLSKVYNTALQGPTIVTTPPGIATNTLFNGVSGAKINVGSWNVSSNVNDPNWVATTITGIFTITPKPGTITVTNLLQPYTGFGIVVSVATSDPFTTTTSYDGSPTPSVTAGNHQVITQNTDPNYLVKADTSILVISQKLSVVSWGTPATHTYPFTLDGSVLNATASVPGHYIYTPAAGFIPNPGNNVLVVNFVPDDSLNYTKVNGTSVVLVIDQGSAVISVIDTIQSFDNLPKFITAFTTPLGINTLTVTYDDAHTSIGDHTGHVTLSSPLYTAPVKNFTLHITSNAGSVFITNYTNRIYTGSDILPTVTTNPPLEAYTITFNGSATPPRGVNSYTTVATLNSPNVGTTTVTMTIIPATPATSWGAIATGTYPYVVGSGILNASSPVPGVWTYDVSVGDTLSAGPHIITGTFHPTDAVDYNTVVITNTVVVNKGNTSMSFLNLNQTYDGGAKTVLVVTIPANISGVSIIGVPQTAAGSYPVSAILTNANWNAPTINGTLIISQSANYNLSWTVPAPVQQGSQLLASILNPVSTIGGSFTFSLPVNSFLNTVGVINLVATFHPTNTNYLPQTISIPLSVYGTPFSDFWIRYASSIYLNLP